MKNKRAFIITLCVLVVMVAVIVVNAIKSSELFSQTVPPVSASSVAAVSQSQGSAAASSTPLEKAVSGVISDYCFTVEKVSVSKEGKYIVNIYKDSIKGEKPDTLLPDYSFLYVTLTVENLREEERELSLGNQMLHVYPKDETVIPYENFIQIYETVGADVSADKRGDRTAYHFNMVPHQVSQVTLVYAIEDKDLQEDLYLYCLPHGRPDEKLNEDGLLEVSPVPLLYLNSFLQDSSS